MAEKEVHVTRNGGGVGFGVIAGILIAVLLVIVMIFFAGGFEFEGGRDVNVDLEAPKVDAPEAPNVDAPSPGD